MQQPAVLRVGIDVGGTFTDLVAADVTRAELISLKVPSTPEAPERGVVDAIEKLLTHYPRKPVVEYLAHSTTIATNALLGQIHLELPRLAMLTTNGFRDVIEIGRQNRGEAYNLFVRRPNPLVAREDRVAVHERMDYRGKALVPLEAAEIERVIEVLRFNQPQALAICLLHSYANNAHERRLAQAVRAEFPQLPVTLSSEIDPEYREYERFSTTVVNAALMPIVRGYLLRLCGELDRLGVTAPLLVMQSNGGMAEADRIARTPAAMIESGPASGVVAAAELARRSAIDRVLSFDMGGTSAKAGTIVEGVVQVAHEFEAAGATHSGRSVKGSGYPVRFPFVDLAEISAGGGTIAWVDEARALRVGPLSAGADPGPACYGRSERATVTDANVVLGRLNQQALAGGTFPIDSSRSQAAIEALARELGSSPEDVAEGIVRIVDAQMAKVLRIVTIERGLDPREFSLVAFGGNGPLHACALAEELGIAEIVVPLDPGVFSAHGLLVAPLQMSYVQAILMPADSIDGAGSDRIFIEMEDSARAALLAQGAADGTVTVRRTYDARYTGQSFELPIAAQGDNSAAFHRTHRSRYGYAALDEAVELVNARLTATATLPALPALANRTKPTSGAPSTRDIWLNRARLSAPVYERAALTAAAQIAGPALIEQFDTCTYVAPGWRARSIESTLVLCHD